MQLINLLLFVVIFNLLEASDLPPLLDSPKMTGCNNFQTCQDHNNDKPQHLGPFSDEACSPYYWICPSVPGICVQCETGKCFNAKGSISGTGYPCAPCAHVSACRKTTTSTSTTTTTTATTSSPPLQNDIVYGAFPANTLSRCSSANPVYISPQSGIRITSPNYPSPYPKRSYCSWSITALTDYYSEIVIMFEHVSLPQKDVLYINDQQQSNSNPKSFQMRAQNFTILFLSNAPTPGTGFSLFIYGKTDIFQKFYVLGGSSYSYGGYSNHYNYQTYVYDIAFEKATITHHYAWPIHYNAMMNAGYDAYGDIIFSSFDGNFIGYGVYKPTKDNTITELPLPILGSSTYVPNAVSIATGIRYINCGYNGTGEHSSCLVYNTVSHEHVTYQINEVKYRGCAVDYRDGKNMLWLGGASDSVIKLNALTGAHDIIATLPNRRYDFGCTIQDGLNILVVCGGKNYQGSVLADCLGLSLSNMTWNSLPSMPQARYGHRLQSLGGGSFLAVAGYGNQYADLYQDGQWITNYLSGFNGYNSNGMWQFGMVLTDVNGINY